MQKNAICTFPVLTADPVHSGIALKNSAGSELGVGIECVKFYWKLTLIDQSAGILAYQYCLSVTL